MAKHSPTTRRDSSLHQRRYMKRRILTTVFVLLIGAGLIVLDRLGLLGTQTNSDYEKYHDRTFAVVRVIDGDTFDIDIPDGKYESTRIRLWGVDTPETVKPDSPVEHFGPEASRFTKQQCLNKTVRLELLPDKTRGKHGRLLAYVYFPDGTMLNAQLISEGYGYADPRFDHPRKKDFAKLQKQARDAKLGLWKAVRNQDLPYYYRKSN